jgi:hypothetical protein
MRRREDHADKLCRRMVLFVTRKQNDFVPVAKLAGGSRTGSSQERDEGDKVTYDVVANRGKESAENLQVK